MNISVFSVLKRFSVVIGLSVTLLTACQTTLLPSTTNKNIVAGRQTLNDLVNAETARELESEVESQFALNKQQRAIKLAALYQNILSIEPNEEVRTKITYRLAQIDTLAYEQRDDISERANEASPSLSELVLSYQRLLISYPNRAENEEVHYQLAKALELQGKLDESLLEIKLILAQFPESKYRAELHFRRGDIYYNLQHYSKALQDYQAVLKSKNSAKYYVNSVYMSGWALFKQNRLLESDLTFLSLLDFIIAQRRIPLSEFEPKDEFSFSEIDNRYVDLVGDIQRVLSISLSQQNQAKSLVALVESYQGNEFKHNFVYLYRHILFKNLATFLLERGLSYDAEMTYQSYLTLAPNSIWAPRYTLALMELYRKQGKQQAIKALKSHYVQQFGQGSAFWNQHLTPNHTRTADQERLMKEVLPNLLAFSYQHSRRLYAGAQSIKIVKDKRKAFANTAHWLGTYLSLAKLPQATLTSSELSLSKGLLDDELLFADASYEAQLYKQALTSYEYIAYHASMSSGGFEQLRKEAAYASTLTIRKMLALYSDENTQMTVQDKGAEVSKALSQPLSTEDQSEKQALIAKRSQLDKAYIEHYPKDERSHTLAIQQAQYSFASENFHLMHYYCNFILQSRGVIETSFSEEISEREITRQSNLNKIPVNLSSKAIKEVQIASQLQANYWYQQGEYVQSEVAYNLALKYVDVKSEAWLTMRKLLAASVYFQGKHFEFSQPLLAVKHYLRLGKQVPESRYSQNALFDAANLLFAQKRWQESLESFLAFQKRHPNHEYSRSIPIKLAKLYENLDQWQMAAEQYLAIVEVAKSDSNLMELQREALYSAAELYLKAENLDKAITTFRTYAHTHHEPFDIAQEVRFKMSQFYQQTKEPIKEYYWYRKIINFHDEKFSTQTVTVDPRSTYLASVASLGLGKAHQQTFKQIKLTLPLNKSLARKKKAMKTAINHYKKLLSLRLAEFVTQGTHHLAQMYRQLSVDVMSSQRPTGLDELALEEYDLLLEEIIYPFEEQAIYIHHSNAQRAWQNIYDKWVAKSFTALAELEPALYDRKYQSSKDNKERSFDAIHSLH